MPDTSAPYDWLDPDERKFLIEADPAAVRDNAHRIYDWLREQGQGADSYTRELLFEKAATALGLDYDVLYDAWLNERAVSTPWKGVTP